MHEDTNPNIRISWLLEDGTIAGPVAHGLAAFDWILPSVGDVIAVNLDDGLDTVRVVERYVVHNIDDYPWWHLMVRHYEIEKSRMATLTYPVKRTGPGAALKP